MAKLLKVQQTLSMEAKHSQRMHIEHFIYMEFFNVSGKFMGGRGNRVVNTLLGHKRPRRT